MRSELEKLKGGLSIYFQGDANYGSTEAANGGAEAIT